MVLVVMHESRYGDDSRYDDINYQSCHQTVRRD